MTFADVRRLKAEFKQDNLVEPQKTGFLEAAGAIVFWHQADWSDKFKCGADGLKGDPEGLPGTSQSDQSISNYPAPNRTDGEWLLLAG